VYHLFPRTFRPLDRRRIREPSLLSFASLGQRVEAEMIYLDWDRGSAADDCPRFEGRTVHLGWFRVCIRLDGTRTSLRRASTGTATNSFFPNT
jgi:hypothetical protein